MSALVLIVSLAVSAEPNSTSTAAGAAASQPAFHEFQRELTGLFKEESQAKAPAARAAAVRAMCDLHQRLVRDSRYATSDVLKEYRARLWSRLTKIKSDIKQQLARDARGNKEALNDLAALESAEPAAVAAAESLGAALSLLDQSQGGPDQLLHFGGGPLPADFGPDLVALIERTINPNFWDVVGGPGSIVYYQPLQCLVVRATAEVHEKIGGLAGDLRGAGRKPCRRPPARTHPLCLPSCAV
jgi:hypothetical protein